MYIFIINFNVAALQNELVAFLDSLVNSIKDRKDTSRHNSE